MTIIIGLGNPGKKFKKTRHNLGFMIVESLKFKVKNFSDWKNIKKFQSEISEGEIADQKVILAKPQTFMNNSGRAVKKLILNLKSEILNLFVIHDDIDLPLGKIRISKGRGAAGHKGVESIIKELGTPKESLPIPSLPASYGAGRLPTRQAKNFIRFRIGIQPETGKPKSIESFVLQKFNKEEEKILKEVIKKTVRIIEFTLIEGIEKAMNKYSQ